MTDPLRPFERVPVDYIDLVPSRDARPPSKRRKLFEFLTMGSRTGPVRDRQTSSADSDEESEEIHKLTEAFRNAATQLGRVVGWLRAQAKRQEKSGE